MRLPIAAIALVLAASSVRGEEPGNLWDVTTSMEAAGMNMPGRTQQVCAPVSAEGPEAMSGNDDRCKVSDVQRSPGKFSYKVQCPDGSGTGEMTYEGKDSYTSVITMTMGADTMKMSSKGKRVGSCDASKVKKQVAAVQAQANASMQQMCAATPEQMLPAQLETYNCDAKYKKQLCDRLGTKEGFSTVAARQPMGNPQLDSGTLPEVAKFCETRPEVVRDRLCTEANKSEDLEFLGEQCPSLAQPIAQRECAGRSFSSPPAEKYRAFCGSYARAGKQVGANESAADAPAPTKESALQDGAKVLKGLFGR